MQHLINPTSLAFIAGIIIWALAVCFLILYKTSKVYDGFASWTLSSFAVGAGSITVGLRGLIPDVLSYVAGNAIIVAAILLIRRGCAKFFNLQQRDTGDYVLLAVFIGLQSYFTFVIESLHARTILVSLTYTAIFFAILKTVWPVRQNKNIPVSSFFLGSIIFFIVFNLFRAAINVYFLLHPLENSATIIFGVSLLLQIPAAMVIYVSLIVNNAQRVEADLQQTRDQICSLYKILPICCHCKKIRNDSSVWEPIEKFIHDNSNAKLSHGICPDCTQEHYPELSETPRQP